MAARIGGVGLPAVASVDVPQNTSVLVIRFEAESATAAQAGARAFAEVYLRNREAAAKTAHDQQVAALNTKIAELEAQVAELNRRIAGGRPRLPRGGDVVRHAGHGHRPALHPADPGQRPGHHDHQPGAGHQ